MADGDPSAVETCPADDELATDPASPLHAHAPGRVTPQNPHQEPIPTSDRRIDSFAPASRRRVDRSSPGRRPSPGPVTGRSPRTAHLAPPTASKVRIQLVQLHSRPATSLPVQAS